MVLAFDGAAGGVNREKVGGCCICHAREGGHLLAVLLGDIADVSEDGVFCICARGGIAEPAHHAVVVAVHRKAVFVEVHADGQKVFGQVEGIAAHAAAQIVNDGGDAFATVVFVVVVVYLASAFPEC